MSEDRPGPSRQPSQDDGHVVKPKSRDHHMMRDVVRNMVANMEYVLNDLHGIMGDIRSLVVQIDSVTDRIDEQCGGAGAVGNTSNMASGSSQSSGHVIRKPEALDGETYWSTRRNGNRKTSKNIKQEETKIYANAPPPLPHPRSFAPPPPVAPPPPLPITPPTAAQREEQCKRLSNVERWLQQEEGIYKHSSLKQPIRRQRDTKAKNSPKRQSSNFEELKLRENRKQSHYVAQPSSQHFTKMAPKVTFLDQYPLNSSPFPVPSKSFDFHACIQPTAKKRDDKTKDVDTCSDNTYLEPLAYCPQKKVQGGKKQIRVFNSHYEENTTADESSLERKTSSFRRFKNASKSCANELDDPKALSSLYDEVAEADESLPSSLPSSPFIQRRRGVSTMLSSRHTYSPGSIRRPQSRLSNTNTYQSLESDLDSNFDQTDPRCLTPDMDWSYLGLVGGDTNKGDRSPGHVYQTIGSPVFRRRRLDRPRGPNPFAFQTSPDVVRRLVTLEEVRSGSSESHVSSSDNYKAASSFDSSVVNHLEEIVGSLVITHVYCKEAKTPEGEDYCGYYEALVDAVLENVAGFESLEEACEHLERHSEVVDDTYINFDDGFEEDEWDMSLQEENDDYFEDDIDFNFLQIPGSQKSDDFSMKSADAINSSTDCDAPSVDVDSSVGLAETTIGDLPLTNAMCGGGGNDSNANISEGALQYDDLDFSRSARRSFVEEDSIAMCTMREDEDGNFSLWSRPFPTEGTHGIGGCANDFMDGMDNFMTSSDETSCQAIGSRSGSSNMSFGSADMVITSPDGEGLMTSSEGDDLYTSQDERLLTSRAENSSETGRSSFSSKTNMSELRQEFFRSLYSACDKRDNEINKSPKQNKGDKREDGEGGKVEGRRASASKVMDTEALALTEITRSTHSIDDSEVGLCPEVLTSSYNRRLSTWTAYAMVHVSAEDVSDSASDIINDNSITCSMTSSYFEADNNAAGSANQGFVDI